MKERWLQWVGALMKKPAMWVVGLACGAPVLVHMANGFRLFF